MLNLTRATTLAVLLIVVVLTVTNIHAETGKLIIMPIYKVGREWSGVVYMCKFVNDHKFVVCGGHCEVYNNIVKARNYYCIYEIVAGKVRVVKCKATNDVPTYYFPGCTFEDAYYVGTNATFNGVPLWKILGFNDTTSEHFYGLGCYGSIGAVGYIYNGTFYIFTTSKVIYKINLGPVKRLKVGKINDTHVAVITGPLSGDLHIFIVDTRKLEVTKHIVVDLEAGVGALDLTKVDDVCHSLIAVGGGSGGHIYIFDASPICEGEAPKLIYHAPPSVTRTAARFYNPFYDHHRYEINNVIAFKTQESGGIGIIYDIVRNESHVINIGSRSYPTKAACVSPSGEYVFLGDTLFMIKRIVASNPTLIIEGEAFDYGQKSTQVNKTISFPYFIKWARFYVYGIYLKSAQVTAGKVTDLRDHVTYWTTGKGWNVFPASTMTISAVSVKKDSLYAAGRYHANTGYASALFAVYVTYPEFTSVDVVDVSRVMLMFDQFRATKLYAEGRDWSDIWQSFINNLAIGGASGTAAGAVTGVASGSAVAGGFIGIIVTLGVAGGLAALSEYRVGMIYMPLVIVEDKNTGEKYAVAYLLASRQTITDFWNSEYGDHLRAEILNKIRNITGYGDLVKKLIVEPIEVASDDNELKKKLRNGELGLLIQKYDLYGLIENKVAMGELKNVEDLRILGVVFIFGLYVHVLRGYPNIEKDWSMNVVIRNMRLVVEPRKNFISPRELCDHVQMVALWVDRKYYASLGTWYKVLHIKPLTCEYDPVHDYAIYHTAFDNFTDVKFAFATKSILKQILEGKIMKYNINVTEGEIRWIELPEGSTALWEAEFYGMAAQPCTCDFTKGECICKYHHDIVDRMRIEAIRLENMPRPLVYIERIYEYKYGKFRHIVQVNDSYVNILEPLFMNGEAWQMWKENGNMFEITATDVVAMDIYGNGTLVEVPVVHLITLENTRWIDPTNGGTLQRCKTMEFRYFFKLPPDAGLRILFNGTSVSATQPVHISIAVYSNVEQDVSVQTKIYIKKYDATAHDWVVHNKYVIDKTVHVPANDTRYVIIDATPYIDEAVKLMRLGYPAMVWVSAQIVDASVGNAFKTNDYDNKTLPILLTVSAEVNKTLYVLVYNVINGSAIANATVNVYKITNATGLELVNTSLTNNTGYAMFVLATGHGYFINVTHEDYLDPNRVVLLGKELVGKYVFFNEYVSTVKYPLVPKTIEGQLVEFVNETVGNWTENKPIRLANGTVFYPVVVQVIYNDTAPVEGARVILVDAVSGQVLVNATTDATGKVLTYIKNGTTINVTVTYGTFVHTRNNIYVNRSIWIVVQVPEKSPLFVPEVALMNLRIFIHEGKTWYIEPLPHLVVTVIYSNIKQNITVLYELYKKDEETDNLTLVKTWNVTYNVPEGTSVWYYWFNVSEPGVYVIHAKIVKYENDTDLRNNELWSNEVKLSGVLDIAPILIIRHLRTRSRMFIVPEDVIQVCIGFRIFTDMKKLKLNYSVDIAGIGYIKRKVMKVAKSETILNITKLSSFVIWRNYTITVPWSRELDIIVNILDTDDDPNNNNVTYTIRIDPNMKILQVEVPKYVQEDAPTDVKVIIRNNLEPGTDITVSVDVEGGDVYSKEAYINNENMTVIVRAKMPKNPESVEFPFFKLRASKYDRELRIVVSGPDVYAEDNVYNTTVTVLSTQFLTASTYLALIVIAIAIIGILLLLTTKKRRITTRTIGGGYI